MNAEICIYLDIDDRRLLKAALDADTQVRLAMRRRDSDSIWSMCVPGSDYVDHALWQLGIKYMLKPGARIYLDTVKCAYVLKGVERYPKGSDFQI